MFRTSDMVLIAVMVSAAAFTYKEKQEAEGQFAAVRKLQSQIRLEEDSITLLKADWSLLAQPARLQKLAEKYQPHHNHQPTDAHQFARIEEIPIRPLDIKEIIGQSRDLMAQGAAVDDTTTGAVHE